jgi:glycosyltransferase involved in cell wall biosynthesis
MNKLVSIIIPTFNREKVLQDTLGSLTSQSYINWECILVDDGSNDNTISIIEKNIAKDKRFSVYNRPFNKQKGPSSCRNIGLEKAKGKYVVFLDSDDVLSKTCLEKRVEIISKNEKLDFVVFSMGHFKSLEDLYIDKNRVSVKLKKEEAVKSFLHFKFLWNTTRPIYNLQFIKNTGGFDESLSVYEDPYLAFRILLKTNYMYEVVDITDCYYRVEENYRAENLNEKVKIKRANNYYLFVMKVFELMNQQDFLEYSLDFKYNYFRFLLEHGNIKEYKVLQKIKELYIKNICFSLKEKGLLFLLPLTVKYENLKGSYYVYNIVKKHFNKLIK